MGEVWAKSNGVKLHEHINHILNAFDKIADKLEDEGIKKAVKLSIGLHDLGKVLPSFQVDILGNATYEPFDVIYTIPHSLFSLFFINKDEMKNIVNNEDHVNFILSAVAYHHWRDNFYEFLERKSEKLRWGIDGIEQYADRLESNLKEEIRQLQDQELRQEIETILRWDNKMASCAKRGIPLSQIAKPPYLIDFEPLRSEPNKDWILIAGFLQRCDHFASWCETENNRNNVEARLEDIEIENTSDMNCVKQKIIQRIKEKKGIEIREEDLWQAKKVKDVKDKNLIFIAPTGFGKTEFAFLWGAGEKFIYTLPLRSAVNQIFSRAEDIFGEGKVGLLHSDADVYLLEKTGDIGDTVQLYELAKNLSYPAIISTGDQFFPYALRPPGYEKIFALFSYARLVIDEVQAYDPRACAIVVEFIKWVHKMGGKFLLMTATLPEFVKNEVEETLGNNFQLINIYDENSALLQRFIKHKIKVRIISNNSENEIEASGLPVNEIIEQARQGKRVLVILNTVKMAQDVYEEIKNQSGNIQVHLLHSRYTLADRKERERQMETEFKNPREDSDNTGKILVATQVVEASLDIDADVLFTELCPLDALVQRMGRVLRRYGACEVLAGHAIPKPQEPNVHVLVFKKGVESGKGKVYNKELLRLSLAWLWKQSKKGKNELPDFEEDSKKDFFEKYFAELINGGNNTNSKDIVYKTIYNKDDWIKNMEDFETSLSEYSKYELVNRFYKSLPEDGSYLKDFYNTLEILKAGYMSSKKSEASEIFRDIHSIQVIPLPQDNEKRKEEIIRDAIQYSEQGHTNFKRGFISKYVVNVEESRYSVSVKPALGLIGYLSKNELKKLVKDLTKNLSEDEFDKRIKGIVRKLEQYLKGIYIKEDVDYDTSTGMYSTRR